MSEDKEFNTMSPERPDFTIDPNENYDEPISVGPEGTDGPMSDPGDEKPRELTDEQWEEVLRHRNTPLGFDADTPRVDARPSSSAHSSSLTKNDIRDAMIEATNATRGPAKKEYTERGQYEKFLMDERWGETAPDDYSTIAAAQFYVDAPRREKEVIDARLELIRAVNHKRENATDLEKYAENKDLAALSKHQTQLLYETPGVRKALETYVQFITHPTDPEWQIRINGRMMSIFEISDRDTQGEVFRQAVQDEVRASMGDYTGPLEDAVVTAEQIAFNLLYVGNTFESFDSQYSRDHRGLVIRQKNPSLNSGDFVMPPLKGNMMPLDSLLSRITRDQEKMKPAGRFTEWARVQGQAALQQVGANKFDQVVVVRDEKQGQSMWWTAQREGGKVVLYVPEAYPVRLMGSIWEDTTVEGRTLMDYLRKGDEIPWNSADGDGLWGSYLDNARAAATIWAFFKGDEKKLLVSAKFDAFGGAPAYIAPWATDLTKSMGQLERGTDYDLMRWALYSSFGMKDTRKRLPNINLNGQFKTVVEKSVGYGKGESPSSLRIMPINRVLFSNDQPNPITRALS